MCRFRVNCCWAKSNSRVLHVVSETARSLFFGCKLCSDEVKNASSTSSVAGGYFENLDD